VDIPPPPPSPEDQPPAPGNQPAGPPPPPPAPSPYGSAAPPYEAGPPYGYPQSSYAQPSPYGEHPQHQQPPYGEHQQHQQPSPYGEQPQYQQPPPYGGNPYQQHNPYAPPGAGGPGAPGMPGPYGVPYGTPGQGWYAVERTTNGLAIASLVTSFTCFPLLGVGLGIGGLRQIKKQGQRGRGLAISGITINSLTTVLVVVLIILGATGVLDDGNTKVDDIKPGQCFNTVGRSLKDYEQGTKEVSRSVDVVSCDKAHDAEAFYTFALDPNGDDGYPGVAAITTQAESTCSGQMDTYLGGASLKDGMTVYFYGPARSLWDTGSRSVTCFFGSSEGKVTGSVKSGGSSDGGSDDGSSGDGGDSGVGV
jgi:hypothetical protein